MEYHLVYCNDCGRAYQSCEDGSSFGCWECSDLSHRELNPNNQKVIIYDGTNPVTPTITSDNQLSTVEPELYTLRDSADEPALESDKESEPSIADDETYDSMLKALDKQITQSASNKEKTSTAGLNTDSGANTHSGSNTHSGANTDSGSNTDSEPDETPLPGVTVTDKIKNDVLMLNVLAPAALMIQEVYNLKDSNSAHSESGEDITLDGVRAIFKFDIKKDAVLIKLPFMGLQIPIQLIAAPYSCKSNLDDLCTYLKDYIADFTGQHIDRLTEFAPFKEFYGKLMAFARQLATFYRHHLVNIMPAGYFDSLPPQITDLRVNHIGPTLYLIPTGLHLHFEYMINLITPQQK